MEKSHDNQSREPATTADMRAMKTEIIEAVKDTMKGLATQETVSAVMETAAAECYVNTDKKTACH